jgi:hypothetical protein
MKLILTLTSLLFVVANAFTQLDSTTRVLINDQMWTSYEHAVLKANHELYLLIKGPYNSGVTKIDSNYNHLKGIYYYENLPTQVSTAGKKLLENTDSTFLVCGKRTSMGSSNAIIYSIDTTLENQWTKLYQAANGTSFEWSDGMMLANGDVFMLAKDITQKGYLARLDGNGNVIWSAQFSDLIHPISCATLNDTTMAVLANKMNPNTTVASVITMTVNLNNAAVLWQTELNGFQGRHLIVYQDTIYSMIDAGASSDTRVLKNVVEQQNGTMLFFPGSSGSMAEGFQMAIDDDKLYVLTGSEGVYDSKVTVMNLNDQSYSNGNQLMSLRAMHFSQNGHEYLIGKGPVYGIKSGFNSEDHIGIIHDTDMVSLLQQQGCGFWNNEGTISSWGYSGNASTISTQANTFSTSTITLQIDTVQPALYVNCVDATSGISELDQTLVHINPNPSNGLFEVENKTSKQLQFYVLDQFGRLIVQKTNLKANTWTSIALKTAGTYYLVSTDGGQTTTTNKLVVIE